MYERIKKAVEEIAKIADSCPENYREKCFSILLEKYLGLELPQEGKAGQAKEDLNGHSTGLSKFLTDNGLKAENLENIFHIEKGVCEIIVKDVKTDKKAIGQIRLALLLAIKNSILGKELFVSAEELQQICQTHALYDVSNFRAIMKKNLNLFLPVVKDWKLTKPGEKEAIELIKILNS